MYRTLSALLVASTLAPAASYAQEGPLRRAGQALDNAGKNIRYRVETEIARGQVTAQERDVLSRVMRRVEWDRPLVGSAMQFEVRPGGTVVLRGSVASDALKRRAVDLVANTVGVAGVVDELAVLKEVKVIETKPAARVIGVTPPVPVQTEVKVNP